MIDGDKIAALFALLLARDVSEAVSAAVQAGHAAAASLSFGVVQTAYANGASTYYLRSIGIEPAIAKTGVKYVHHKASKP